MIKIELSRHVEKFIDEQPPKVQAKIARAIDLLETFGLRLTEPHLKKMASVNLWELRIIFASNIYRIFLCSGKNKLILLHGFCKKSQKTPSKEINLALKRMKEIK